jgi:cytochrome c-type protein NapC
MSTVQHPISLLGYVCVVSAGLAVAILLTYLLKKPPLNFATKIWLLVGLGLLPGLSATSSTVAGMEATTERHFCGSCHVMTPYVMDAQDAASQSLAARHGRNPFFGDRNCYICHADYGMYGYPVTKMNGMRHVYEYYIGGWNELTIPEAFARIHLQKPYDNTNCRQCHTGTLADWKTVPEHVALATELESNAVSCASSGCHGYAHPFTKGDGGDASQLPPSALGTDLTPEAREKAHAARRAERAARAAAEASAQAERDAAREAARKAARERTAPKEEIKP